MLKSIFDYVVEREPFLRFDQSKEVKLHCAMCGFQNTHLENIQPHWKGKDNRLSVYLNFSCESGCDFTLEFLQHKGDTLIETRGTHYEEKRANESEESKTEWPLYVGNQTPQ